MSPDETINVLRDTLKQCVTEVPDTMLSVEPDEYWTDLVARFVFKLSSRGLYIVEREAYDAVRTVIANGRYESLVCSRCQGFGIQMGGIQCALCSGVGRIKTVPNG
jgi:hypothetical protein